MKEKGETCNDDQSPKETPQRTMRLMIDQILKAVSSCGNAERLQLGQEFSKHRNKVFSNFQARLLFKAKL